MISVTCINLAARPDRWAHMQAVAKSAGVPLQRFEAITPDDPECQRHLAKPGQGRLRSSLLPTEVACFLSHRALWRRLVDSGDPYGIILEDDMLLSEGFAAMTALDWIPKGADVIRLETGGKVSVLSAVRPLAGLNRKIGLLRSSQYGSGAYVISRKAARRLLADTGPIVDPVDVVKFHRRSRFFRSAKIYQVFPAPAVQGLYVDASRAEGWAQSSITVERVANAETLLASRHVHVDRKKSLFSRAVRVLRAAARQDRRTVVEVEFD